MAGAKYPYDFGCQAVPGSGCYRVPVNLFSALPNRCSRGFAMPKQRRVGIALEIDQPFPHHQEVFLGIQRYVREHPHWQCVIDEHPGYALHRRPYVAGYDGVIARAPKAVQDRLKRAGVPLVNVVPDFHRPGVASVYSDAQIVGRQAAEHLINRGFNRLLAVYDDTYRQPRVVAKALDDFARQAGVDCRLRAIKEGYYREGPDWVAFEKDIFDALGGIKPPTGLFITNASAARLVVQHASANGLRVPHDLAVICQHNVLSMVNVPPQITSIDLNFPRVGYEAAALLEQMMGGEPAPHDPVLVPPKGVIGRETTDYYAVEDEVVAEALRYISSRLHEKLRVEDIAYVLHISTRSLQQRFRKAMGVGPSDEIRRLRLEKAKRLLLEPDRQIGSIPREVGFATLYVMNQVFHRELGMSPGAYRKSVLSSD